MVKVVKQRLERKSNTEQDSEEVGGVEQGIARALGYTSVCFSVTTFHLKAQTRES